MIKTTADKIAQDLEKMTRNRLPLGLAFEVLAKRARSVEELVVVEVMKESFQEMCCEQERLSA